MITQGNTTEHAQELAEVSEYAQQIRPRARVGRIYAIFLQIDPIRYA